MCGTRKLSEAIKPQGDDMPQNLVKTSSGYVYRKSIPADVRHIIKQSEFKRSLGKDFRSAKIEWAKLEAQVTKMIEDARLSLAAQHSIDSYLKRSADSRLKSISADTPGLSSQVSALYLAGLDVDLELRRTRARDEDDFDELSENIKDMLPRINRAIATGEVQAFFPVVSQLLLGRGYLLDATIEQMQTLTYDVLLSIQAGYRALAERQDGNLVKPAISLTTEPLSAVWDPPPEVNTTPSKQPPRLSNVMPLLSDHLSSKGERNRTNKLSFWRGFTEFCDDKFLQDVTPADVYNFLESRLKAKTKPWATDTMNKAKSLISQGFSLSITKSLCEKNPVSDVLVSPRISLQEEEARSEKRLPLKVSHLNQLFSSAWYDPEAQNWRGKLKGDLAARYWVPLICLFHGLRITESLQLFKSDIILSDIPLLKIEVESSGKVGEVKRTLKNPSTKRKVPIHPNLIELGFIEYVKTCANWTETKMLFPSSIPDDDSKKPVLGRAPSQALLRFMRNDLKWPRGFCIHSFRHSVEDSIRDAQVDEPWPPGLSQFYTGRRLPRNGDWHFFLPQGSEIDYGQGYNPERIVKYVSRIKYEGLNLPPPFLVWLGDKPAVSRQLQIATLRAKHNIL